MRTAEVGVLISMENSNAIKSEELKQTYIDIKKQLAQSVDTTPARNKENPGEKKSAVKDWFKGIGGRQRKFQEEHKDGLI